MEIPEYEEFDPAEKDRIKKNFETFEKVYNEQVLEKSNGSKQS